MFISKSTSLCKPISIKHIFTIKKPNRHFKEQKHQKDKLTLIKLSTFHPWKKNTIKKH